MKRCPECGRDYNDDSMSFCLDDGSELLFGPASMDEPATAILSEPGAIGTGFPASESLTRPQINTTDQTDILSRGAVAEIPDNLGGLLKKRRFWHKKHASVAEAGNHSARRTAKPLIAIVAALILLVGGFFGYQYFKPGTSDQINSIAVLPFENRSGNPDSEYLSDGLSDSLIYRLTQLPNLKVSPTSSVVRYKGKQADVAEIAKELDVDAVMSGKLAQRGDDLTISVELIDARTKKLIWAEQYDRKMADLLATQREIATTITQKLQLKLSGDEAKGITKKYTDNNEAYQLYLKGRFHFAKRTKDDILKGIDFFEQAIKLDPNFALAFSSIAESYNVMPSHGYLSPRDATSEARVAAQKALAIDSSLAEAHAQLASILSNYDWNWAEAEREYRRALELGPDNSTSHLRYGQYLWAVGRLDESIVELSKSLELEPLSLTSAANLTLVYLRAGQKQKALELAKRTHDLDPNFVTGRLALGAAYISNGMYDEAIRLSERLLQAEPTNQWMLWIGGYAYAKSGRRPEADEIVDRLKEIAKTQYGVSYYSASIYAALGEKDKAFVELENSFEQRDWWAMRMKSDSLMDSLRDDARFHALVKRLNLPE
jgi:TolB-like protein/Tfp pilus assembly protein PilF